MATRPFTPSYGRGQDIACSVTSASAAIGNPAPNLVLTNTGAEAVYVRTGDSTVTATTADFIVLSNSSVAISISREDTHVAAITASATSTLNVIPGQGS